MGDNIDTIKKIKLPCLNKLKANRLTADRQLRETSVVPKSTISRVIQQQGNCEEMNGHYATDKNELPQNREAGR
jgi:hypothetical protein